MYLYSIFYTEDLSQLVVFVNVPKIQMILKDTVAYPFMLFCPFRPSPKCPQEIFEDNFKN